MNKSETLQTIQIHRTKLNHSLNSPGWTPWAIVGALASLSWVTLDLLKTKPFDVFEATNIALLLYFLYPTIRSFHYFKKTKKSVRTKPTLYYLQSELGAIRGLVVFEVAVLIYIFYFVALLRIVDGFYAITFYIYFALSILSLITLVLLRTTIHIPKTRKKSKFSFQQFVGPMYIIIRMIISIGFYLNLNSFSQLSITNIKLGLLVFGMYLLTQLFLGLKRHSPIVSSLDRLIEDVTFDQIDSEEALNRLKIVVKGITFKDILLPHMTSLWNLHSEFNTVCDRIIKELNLISSNEERLVKESLIKSAHGNLDILKELNKKIDKTRKDITRTSDFLRPHENSTEDYQETIQELLRTSEESDSKLFQVEERIKTMLKESN